MTPTQATGPRILALDASTTAVGFCIADGDAYVASGVYLPRGGEWWDRVTAVGNWLTNTLIADGDIATVVYELATGNRGNMRTNRLLGAVEYEARYVTAKLYRQFAPVTASQVIASGVHKRQLWAAAAITKRPMDDRYAGDEADAIGVWQAWLAQEIGRTYATANV